MNYDELMKLRPDLQQTPEELCPIEISSGEFGGIVYRLGKMWFEEEDSSKLSFECDVLQGKIPEGKTDEFNHLIGNYILHILMEQIRRNDEQDEDYQEGAEG